MCRLPMPPRYRCRCVTGVYMYTILSKHQGTGYKRSIPDRQSGIWMILAVHTDGASTCVICANLASFAIRCLSVGSAQSRTTHAMTPLASYSAVAAVTPSHYVRPACQYRYGFRVLGQSVRSSLAGSEMQSFCDRGSAGGCTRVMASLIQEQQQLVKALMRCSKAQYHRRKSHQSRRKSATFFTVVITS